ncbi:MAG: hypothetical protein Q3971_06800 [Moraxella sp.]|nr:hypothetical protein [Moraxella sp.]
MQIQKLTAVPSTPTTPNTFFFISSSSAPNYVELYVSSNDGATLKRLINEADIKALIAAQISTAGKYTVVDDINARNDLSQKGFAYVKDATADSTVKAGGAFYLYNETDSTWVKLSEAESMDTSLSWDSIQGKPNVTAHQIETAVSQAHTHANKTELDKIGQDSQGNLTYDGKAVGGVTVVANW